ncbi:MAG: alpha/beta hydrolase [Burkholderiales bacterium]
MTRTTPARPPFDPELGAVLTLLSDRLPPYFTMEQIPDLRSMAAPPIDPESVAQAGIVSSDVTIPTQDGGEIVLTILEAEGRTGTGPGFYYIHGGGMVSGTRWSGVPGVFPWLHRFEAVAVTVEYRLAPEFPDPVPIEDSYAGLIWIAEHANEIGIDLNRLIVMGGSAGGGLAAGLAHLSRDRGGPSLAGQLLMYPMLDDRDSTMSTRQIDGIGIWDRTSNVTGWTAYLGDRRGTDRVSVYAAPARATDLSGLPPAFIDCGSAEVFRDEDVSYASAIWAAGGQAELHVWPGGFHMFDNLAPQAVLSQQMRAAREGWLARILDA